MVAHPSSYSVSRKKEGAEITSSPFLFNVWIFSMKHQYLSDSDTGSNDPLAFRSSKW